jgi:hypothetical protein
MNRLILFALFSIALAIPQPRKLFHEHFEDFMDMIQEEVGPEIDYISSTYVDSADFMGAINYMFTPKFKDLIYEMEEIPEFLAVSLHFIYLGS